MACLPPQLPVLLFTSLSLCISPACTLLTPSYFPLPAPASTLLSHSFLPVLQPALLYPCPVSIRLNRPSSHLFLSLPRQVHLNFPSVPLLLAFVLLNNPLTVLSLNGDVSILVALMS
jgi:hypothetical protein